MPTNFQQFVSQDEELRRVQANIANFGQQLQTGPYFGGNTLTQALTSGVDNKIAHGLGRTPVLWILFDQDTNSTVWRTAWDENFITFRCSTTCSVKVWVN